VKICNNISTLTQLNIDKTFLYGPLIRKSYIRSILLIPLTPEHKIS